MDGLTKRKQPDRSKINLHPRGDREGRQFGRGRAQGIGDHGRGPLTRQQDSHFYAGALTIRMANP